MGRAEQEFRLQIRCSKTLDEAHALRGGLRRDRRPGGRPSSHTRRGLGGARRVWRRLASGRDRFAEGVSSEF